MRRNGLFGIGLFGLVGLIGPGCGGDEESSAPSFDEIANQYSSPTGEIASAEDAQGVAQAYAEVQSRQFAGERRGESYEYACPAGGNCSVSGSGSQSGGSASYDCSSCCYEAGCCWDGSGWMVYSSGGTETFSYCGAWDGSGNCGGSSWSGSWSYCLASDGTLSFLVEYNGGTYVVSGSYDLATGSGTWTVSSANGTWTCTASSGTGSCTDGTNTYSW